MGVFSHIQIERIDADIELLIGCDAPEELAPIEVRRSEDGGPFAARTIFGWVINGPVGRNSAPDHTANFVQVADASLEAQLKNFCDFEFNDTEHSYKPTLPK